MKTYEEFFDWCGKHGLDNDRLIGIVFDLTPQTVRNWRKKVPDEQLKKLEKGPPPYLALVCSGYEEQRRLTGDLIPAFPKPTMSWLEEWRHSEKLRTLESVGIAFGLTRQGIHAWFKRESLPRWLPLACLGYQMRHSKENAKIS